MDLLVAWDWEYDLAFVTRLVNRATEAGLAAKALHTREIEAGASINPAEVKVLLDRASDVSQAVASLARAARQAGAYVVNDPDLVPDATDKATMHLRLMAAGVHVPWTILLAPLADRRPGELDALPRIGTPFVVKPARGSGGQGVVVDASTLTDILVARARFKDDKYLVQERVEPKIVDQRPAYFRVLFCLGDIAVCFWDPKTRVYTPLSPEQEASAWCQEVREVARVTARVSGMDLFSTEVAMTADGRPVSVDYVNDMCDLRPASEASDGVPDRLLDAIAARLVVLARQVPPTTATTRQ